MNSTHRCEIVAIDKVLPHPNADRLEIIPVFGYTVVSGKGNFKPGDFGIYFPPDSVVPVLSQFEFLWPDIQAGEEIAYRKRRIKSKRLRGVISEGLLLPLEDFYPIIGNEMYPESPWTPGTDLAPELGVEHYNPPEPTSTGGDTERAPRKKRYPKTVIGWIRFLLNKAGLLRRTNDQEDIILPIPVYDIDAYQRYKHLFKDELVSITEKIHGSNARYVYIDGKMYAGSHYQWKKKVKGSVWWEALENCPWIEEFCKTFPGYVVYGEVVPTQKGFDYGCKNKPKVFIFDVLDATGQWLSDDRIYDLIWAPETERTPLLVSFLLSNNWVPVLTVGIYTEDLVKSYLDGPSTVPGANHIREGIVIKPTVERKDYHIGRIIMKYVSSVYLEKSEE